MSENRVPAGVPTGGQFTASEKAESGVQIGSVSATEGHVALADDPSRDDVFNGLCEANRMLTCVSGGRDVEVQVKINEFDRHKGKILVVEDGVVVAISLFDAPRSRMRAQAHAADHVASLADPEQTRIRAEHDAGAHDGDPKFARGYCSRCERALEGAADTVYRDEHMLNEGWGV